MSAQRSANAPSPDQSQRSRRSQLLVTEKSPGRGCGLVVAACGEEGLGEVVVGVDTARAERREFRVVFDRLVDSPQPRQHDAAVLKCAGKAGIERERAIIVFERAG